MLCRFFARFKYLSFFFYFLLKDSKIRETLGFLLFLNYHLVWCSGRDEGIILYLKINENFMHLILQHGFWFVHIPFCSMIKFQFLAQFLVDNLSHPHVLSFIFFWCYFATFTYVINSFVSITTYPKFVIPLPIIYFCFNVISSYGVIFCCY